MRELGLLSSVLALFFSLFNRPDNDDINNWRMVVV